MVEAKQLIPFKQSYLEKFQLNQKFEKQNESLKKK